MESWRAKLEEGHPEGAWDLFIERYRPLILVTIRRMISDREDVFDVFAHVCHALFAHDLARLRRFRVDVARPAEFSTWLVTVVHNLVIDWLRQRDGRPRLKVPAALSPLQQCIFRHVFVHQRSHLEAFELVRGAPDGDTPSGASANELSYGAFLKELAETYRIVERSHSRGAMRYLAGPPPLAEHEGAGLDGLDLSAIRTRLAGALGSLCPEERLAIQLYVVEGLAAADVARTLGWPNAKAVYNKVYRGLAQLRASLERDGVRRGDL